MHYQAGTETTKAKPRREAEGFFKRYIHGRGIDIGHGGNPLTPTCEGWELDQGDATKLPGLPDNVFDWVYSSHLLEHLDEPEEALSRWWNIVKPGGYLIVCVPDEILYEKCEFPSTSNPDHKYTYTIKRAQPSNPKSKNLADMLGVLEGGEIQYIKLCDTNGEYQIEAVVKKTTVTSLKFLDTFFGGVSCSTCNKDKMILVGFYKNGNTLLRCLVCGQHLVLKTSDVLVECQKSLGVKDEKTNP